MGAGGMLGSGRPAVSWGACKCMPQCCKSLADTHCYSQTEGRQSYTKPPGECRTCSILMPTYGRITRPWSFSCRMTSTAVSTGMAKLTPSARGGAQYGCGFADVGLNRMGTGRIHSCAHQKSTQLRRCSQQHITAPQRPTCRHRLRCGNAHHLSRRTARQSCFASECIALQAAGTQQTGYGQPSSPAATAFMAEMPTTSPSRLTSGPPELPWNAETKGGRGGVVPGMGLAEHIIVCLEGSLQALQQLGRTGDLPNQSLTPPLPYLGYLEASVWM